MPEQWIIRVDGKEYGPADLTTLREWKAEGRVLPANEARQSDETSWEKAEKIPGLFEAAQPPVQIATPHFPRAVSNKNILQETFTIYTRGFFKYLGLTLLVVGPSICAQLTATFIDGNPGTNPDARTLVAGAFALCMLLLGLVLTPVYIAGIQILTTAHAAGERISFFTALNEAVKFWPRVALLCVFVFLCFAFWTVMPFVVILGIAVSKVSIFSILFALLILVVMVWVTGRLFINFLFWQQFAVLEGCGVLESLRRSRELARSGSHLPWYRRPMWRGVFIYSLWCGLILALNWPLVSQFFHVISSINISGITDSQKLLETIQNDMKNSGVAGTFAANVLQAILKPLLGIAFVLLFLDSNSMATEK
ncbi:MAG TPA: GYF domain-containing protein [Chthoniobacterales bacterium]|jgi:hypothetical protein